MLAGKLFLVNVTSGATVTLTRVATNLENLEYSGISLNMENSGNSVQPQGKIVRVFFSSSLKYLCKRAVDWVNRIIRILGSSDPGQSVVVTLLELMWKDP